MPANSRWDLIRGLKGQKGRSIEFVMLYVPCMVQNSVYQTNLTCTEMWTRQIHSLLHVSAILECLHQGVLVSVKAVPFELPRHVTHMHTY